MLLGATSVVIAGSIAVFVWRSRRVEERAELLAAAKTTAWGEKLAREPSPPRWPQRRSLSGHDFPPGVLSLTWDDGPDRETLTLARYLHDAHVSATFFVVNEWVDGVSDEPGVGETRWETGYSHFPVLSELARLGHRLGSHTENHALLTQISFTDVGKQIGNCQRAADSFTKNELRIFRAPGGAWSHDTGASGMRDNFLSDVVGPIRWDIDAKDWDGSLYCRGAPAEECEPGPAKDKDGHVETRVRASVMAKRYLAAIDGEKRGIVLLHDRVGAVGSTYALDVAHALIPELVKRDYVFAAPVLAFSPMTMRGTSAGRTGSAAESSRGVSLSLFTDFDNDGRADLCVVRAEALRCSPTRPKEGSVPEHVALTIERPVMSMPPDVSAIASGDINGDGRADLCLLRGDRQSVSCAMAGETWLEARGTLAAAAAPAGAPPSSSSSPSVVMNGGFLWLVDLDGDGHADVCALQLNQESAGATMRTSLRCALNRAGRFVEPSVWLADVDRLSVTLADVDGDRRADVCFVESDAVVCALSNGRSFARSPPSSPWSSKLRTPATIRAADLNGDGRADLCAIEATGSIRCALAGSKGWKDFSLWGSLPPGVGPVQSILADITNDGRADLCVIAKLDGAVWCGAAP